MEEVSFETENRETSRSSHDGGSEREGDGASERAKEVTSRGHD